MPIRIPPLRILLCYPALAAFLYLTFSSVIWPFIQHGIPTATEQQAGSGHLIAAVLQSVAGFLLVSLLRGGTPIATATWIFDDLRNPRDRNAQRELLAVFLPFVPLLAYMVFLSSFFFLPMMVGYMAGIAWVANFCIWTLVRASR